MKELRPVQVILLGFLITIFAGSILLALPIATQSGQATPYIDALFTATTSVCVTGLIVETTMTHWSIFGQAVIILLVVYPRTISPEPEFYTFNPDKSIL
mgnify:CR=1 FL=1